MPMSCHGYVFWFWVLWFLFHKVLLWCFFTPSFDWFLLVHSALISVTCVSLTPQPVCVGTYSAAFTIVTLSVELPACSAPFLLCISLFMISAISVQLLVIFCFLFSSSFWVLDQTASHYSASCHLNCLVLIFMVLPPYYTLQQLSQFTIKRINNELLVLIYGLEAHTHQTSRSYQQQRLKVALTAATKQRGYTKLAG